jgi:choline-sulfatase
MADELSPKTLGCCGHPSVKTPHLDALASRGTRFTSAYTNSPVCMAARATFATGQYPHQSGYWDNSLAYDGKATSWGHRLRQTGHRFTSIGKLHYLKDAPTGIEEEIIPMHVVGGGDIYGLLREEQPARPQSSQLAEKMGPGEGDYIRYDRKITELSEKWLAEHAVSQTRPWVLFVSYLAPHFPLIVPQEYIDLYPLAGIPMPKKLSGEGHAGHPWWETFAKGYDFDRYFKDDEHRRRAIQAYYALCSFVDENVGKVLKALERSGAADRTVIAFAADHGDNLGARGLWGKSTMYEESAGIPMILAGPGLPQGKVCKTPVSLADFYPTVLQTVGESLSAQEKALPGRSLLELVREPDDTQRLAFSEYHASCARTASFMLRKGDHKYVHYEGYAAQLFDLAQDPEETRNLAQDPAYAALCAQFDVILRAMLDPTEVDTRAKRAQAIRVAELGGASAILAQRTPSFTPIPI